MLGRSRILNHSMRYGRSFSHHHHETPESRIQDLHLHLPVASSPKGNYINCVQVGKLVYCAGHLPQPHHGNLVVGKIGKDLSVDDGYNAAKFCGLNIIATLKQHLGELSRVKRVVKINGFVNCTDDFTQQPKVVNGCSDVMVAVFSQEIGTHARAAVGTNSLPLGVAVEVEAIVEVE